MILLINSAGILNDVEEFYTNKTKDEIEEKHRELFESKAYMLPLAIGVLAANLRKKGFTVIHRDMLKQVSRFLTRQLARDDFAEWLVQDKKTPLMEEYLAKALDVLPPHMDQVKLIGMSVRSYIQYPYALSLAKMLNRLFPGISICLGGCYITLAKHNFPQYISFVVKGDGGVPICHLADHLINQAPYNPDIPGLYQITASEVPGEEKNQEPAENEEVPDFSGLDLTPYLSYYLHPPFPTGRERPDQPYLTFDYRTSMGCSNKCSFCTNRKVGGLRFKNVEKVIADLKSLKQRYLNANDKLYITFADSSINNSPKHINAVMDAIIENKLDMEWFAFVNVRNMTLELLEKFARAGCVVLFWGIEALTQRMLNIYNKQFQQEAFQPMFLQAMKLKIVNVVSLIYNGPHETDEDFDQLVKFIDTYSVYKPFFIPNLCDFILEQNSDMYNHPEKYNIEVLMAENDPYSTIQPSFQWKEKERDLEEMKKQRKIRKEKIERLLFKFWGRTLN